MVKIHFSDYFGVAPELLEEHGAFNVSLVNDLPLFVDPFLLFNSTKPYYRELHDQIINYLRFLRDKSEDGGIRSGLLHAWYTFPEVKQNWLGYSLVGNAGTGLGSDFARSLHKNLNSVFSSFGSEQITRGSHLEKLCLVDSGVGRDHISDFATNLIKDYLLAYTQEFATKHLRAELVREFAVAKAQFNYDTETWVTGTYLLPHNEQDDDFVILTPKDLLTKDDIWISKADLLSQFGSVTNAVANVQLRDQINNYFLQVLPKEPSRKDELDAVAKVIRAHPVLIEYYIRYKEEHGDEAVASSDKRVNETELFFIRQLAPFAEYLAKHTSFYATPGATYKEARERILFLKDVIERKGGHRIFYVGDEPVRKETDLHILFRLTWLGTPSDVSREVNDGRGPADFKVSRGALDKTIVEFKLASNRQLERNLQKQAEIYQAASDASHGMKVIVYFSEAEYERVQRILKALGLERSPDIILIDARPDNKPSASKA
jgi:hypothetical protein